MGADWLGDDVVLGFETNLDFSNQISGCRLNGRVDGRFIVYLLSVLKTLEETKLLEVWKA